MMNRLLISAACASLFGPAAMPAAAEVPYLSSSTLGAGGISLSPRYRIDAAVGGLRDMAARQDIWLKPDFSGALVDPAHVEVVPDDARVSEEEAILLTARIACDDGTFLPAESCQWSVLSGPLHAGAGGWHVAQPVHSDASAVVEARAGGLAALGHLVVLNSNPDNYGIFGSDDVDDAWQAQHFGPDNPQGKGSADPDHDGRDNYYEFTTGTDPLDNLDFFALRDVEGNQAIPYFEVVTWIDDAGLEQSERQVAYMHTGVDVRFGPLLPGRTYRVEQATDVREGPWLSVTNVAVASGVALHEVDEAQYGTNVAFYRIGVEYPWRTVP